MSFTIGLQIVGVGVCACVIFDLWQLAFQRLTGIPPTNWALVGRWSINLVTEGQLIAHNLEAQPEKQNELAVGWFVHYSVAVAYATIYALLMSTNKLTAGLTDGLLFGVVSVIVPWLIFLPCLGKGIMGRLTPNPQLVCALALMMHSLFGVAVGLGFNLLAPN